MSPGDGVTAGSSYPIVMLWAVPRSVSTAFEKMMRTRGDHECFHEPFGEPWYAGPEAMAPLRRRSAVPGESTFVEVLRTLRTAAERGPVFSKDFPHYLLGRWDTEVDGRPWLDGMVHSFLIRDPRQQLASLRHRWADLEEGEAGHEGQRRLFDELTAATGTPPPVIDADDLLDDPAAIVDAWCAAVGIPPDPSALSWEASSTTSEFSFYDGGSWHENLASSTGLRRQRQEYSVDHTHPDIADMVTRALEHYEHLRAHRLRPVDGAAHAAAG